MVPATSFNGLVVVCLIAVAAPLLLSLARGLRVPSVVAEIGAGILVGPSGLGLVQVDEAIRLLSLLGLAFLLFAAGLEIDARALRGRSLRLSVIGFAGSFALALAVGGTLQAAGLVGDATFIAIVLSATSLGVIVPVLKDAGESASPFGQLVIAASSIADFGAIVLLSLLFSRDSSGIGAQLILIGGFAAAIVAVGFVIARTGRTMVLSGVLVRLQDTTAQIRVRLAWLLLVALVALAAKLGLEVILGAFAAGVLLGVVDRDEQMTHPQFHTKLDGAAFGIFVPVFFVTTGLRFDLDALTGSASTLALVPILLLALAAARGLPALLYRVSRRRTIAAGLLQATSLPFIAAASQIGVELGIVTPGVAAALVGAGLASVLVFPAATVALLRPSADPTPHATPILGGTR